MRPNLSILLKPPPKVAVVILNWNGKKFLEQFLPSVLQSSYQNLDVIVVDNFSSDDSISYLASTYPTIRVIALNHNYGFARGYNEALTLVQSEYLILLNSDVEVVPGWIEPMIALLESDSSIAACQPKMLAYHNQHLFEYAGAAGGWIDRYGYPFSRGRVFEVCEVDKGQYDESVPIFWASGAALCIRASVFHEVKGFDNYFFAHQEEIDLCWRIQLAGYRVYSCPSSIIYHVGGGTLPRGNSKKTYLNFRNNHIMLAKNLPFGQKIWIIPYRVALDWLTALKGLLTGDAGYSAAVIRAHFGFLRWIFFHQKKSVFPKTKKGELRGRLERNIVWLHFIKKKNTFSEIVGKSH